jgi:hypothetical protein
MHSIEQQSYCVCGLKSFHFKFIWFVLYSVIIKDEVLLTVGCPIFPPFYIDSQISVHRKFKNRSVDI